MVQVRDIYSFNSSELYINFSIQHKVKSARTIQNESSAESDYQ